MSWVANKTMSISNGSTSGRVVGPSDVTAINVASIKVGARKRPADQEAVERLKEDILRQGLLQPIGVRASNGNKGGPFELIFGHHRVKAFQQLGETHDTIPAIIFPSDTPDWQVELAEISENFHRRELSPDEAKAHTLRYMAILKRHRLVATAEEVSATKGKALGGANSKAKNSAPPVTDGHKGSEEKPSKPTATQATSTGLGVKRETVSRRVTEAAKDAGLAGVTAETATADQLDLMAKAVEQRAEEKKAERAKRQGQKSTETTKAKKEVEKAIEKISTGMDIEGEANAEAVSALLTALDLATDTGGPAFTQAVVRKWWKQLEPDGEVRFNPKMFSKGTV